MVSGAIGDLMLALLGGLVAGASEPRNPAVRSNVSSRAAGRVCFAVLVVELTQTAAALIGIGLIY